jgi:hypothetical protein
MEDQSRIVAYLAIVTEVIDLDIQQEVADIQHQQQENFTLAAIDQTERTAKQQQQRRQYIEQGDEELAQHWQQSSHDPTGQQGQRREEVTEAQIGRTDHADILSER